MAHLGVIDSSLLTNIAAAVRSVKDSSSKYTPPKMAEELNSYVVEREAALAEQKELIEELESKIRQAQGSNSSFANSIVDRSITSIGADDLTSAVEIGDYAFYGCTDLQEVAFSDNISRIGDYAFYGATLWNVEFPDGLTEIGESALAGITTLQTVKFGRPPENSSLKIGANAFINGNEVRRIDMRLCRDCAPEVDSQVFYDNAESNYEIWADENYISEMQSSDFGQRVPHASWIDWYIYYDEESSTTSPRVYVPNTVPSIFNEAFSSGSLDIIEFEKNSSLTTIYEMAFYNCQNLTSISIPGSVTEIRDGAFEDCSRLSEIRFLEHTSVPTLGEGVFINVPSDTNDFMILVPFNLYEEWKVAPNWSVYADYIVASY